MAVRADVVAKAGLSTSEADGSAEAHVETGPMVSESDAAWDRPREVPARPAAAAPLEAAGDDTTLSPSPPEAGGTADAYAGSLIPRHILMVAAGAVMGAVLGIAAYSVAVSSDNPGAPSFGAGPGARPQAGQGAPGALPAQQGGQVRPGGQGQAQPGLQGAIPQANLLPRAPDFTGQVRALTGTALTIDTPQGSRTVQVSSQTQIVRSDGSRGTLADLTRGATVAVVATQDPVDRVLRADAIGIVR